MQDGAPALADIVPAPQGVQVAPPKAEYEPAAHDAHEKGMPPIQSHDPSTALRASAAEPKVPGVVHVKA